MSLGDTRWTDLANRSSTLLLAVPLGSTEQHGPHLPLSTDTDIAAALAERLAQARPNVMVAPALPYGSSGEHAGFPGTLSIGQDALERIVVELVRSADDFAGVVLVSAHGGNAEPLDRAVETLRGEGRRVVTWAPRDYRDAHAGRSETSLLLALDPKRVCSDAAAPGATAALPDLIDTLRTDGVRAVSPSGVLGDPTGASAEEGMALFDALTADLIAKVDDFVG
jgi:creatinine amidohydrolase